MADGTGSKDVRSGEQSEADLRESMLHELESHTPEGESPSRRTLRRERFLFAPLALIAVIGGGIALHCIAGWSAVIVGGFVVAAYVALGWGPELVSAALRRGEHERMERRVDREIERRRGDGGGG